MKKILLYMEKNYPNIPTNDKDAYQYYNKQCDLYNKLLLSQLQNLDAAPAGITPIKYPVIIKPIINLYGMSNGFKKINSLEEFREDKNIGLFWQTYLDGVQYNLDIDQNKINKMYNDSYSSLFECCLLCYFPLQMAYHHTGIYHRLLGH